MVSRTRSVPIVGVIAAALLAAAVGVVHSVRAGDQAPADYTKIRREHVETGSEHQVTKGSCASTIDRYPQMFLPAPPRRPGCPALRQQGCPKCNALAQSPDLQREVADIGRIHPVEHRPAVTGPTS